MEGYEQRNKMMWLTCLKELLWLLCWDETIGVNGGSRENNQEPVANVQVKKMVVDETVLVVVISAEKWIDSEYILHV